MSAISMSLCDRAAEVNYEAEKLCCETAALIAFLLSDETGYVTGQNVVIDGGTMLPNEQMDPVLGPLLELFGGD